MATIEAIRRIKAELPGVFTVLGVSNVSFGLKPAARHVLNSVFLHECVEAGLDAAIVHAARIMPLNRIDEHQRQVCLDLIYDRRPQGYDPLQELLAIFEDVNAAEVEREDRSGWPVEERLKHRIIDGDRDGLEADLEEALASRPALSIVNDVLLEGMKVVGDLFASGEMQLPFVLQSAECMKAAVAYLEPHMEKADQGGKGRIVLGTVKGDVHDIGKNLVDIILTNNGYEVFNLGIKVPIADLIAKAEEVSADALGMSGLLVKSTLIMRDNLEELNQRGLSTLPVLLGGAALTRSYVERDLRGVYEGRVFYGKDAFEGLRTMERLMTLKKGAGLDSDPEFGRELTGRVLPKREKREVDLSALPSRSPDVETDNPVFVPPWLGSQVVKGISIDEIAAFHIVTMGNAISEATAELFEANRYQDYLLLHGLGVEMAEALAEYWHLRIRQEWGFADEDGPSLAGLFRQQYRGGRYSWGYPACPDLEDNLKVAELLEADRIDVTVAEGFQYHPEQTTSALICHHPKAKYFVAR